MDYDPFLLPIEGKNPSGQDLRNDARFHAIERLFDPAARQLRVNADGTLNSNAASVEWGQIAEDGLGLAKDGRDLRLLVKMVRVGFAEDSFAGLAAGLDMLVSTVQQHWDTVHPELRDRDTPAAQVQPRMNALKQIENDDNGLLGDLKCGVVTSPRGVGPLTGEDISMGMVRFFDIKSRYSGATAAELAELEAQHEARVNRVKAGTRAMAAEAPDDAAQLLDDVIAAQEKVSALCAEFSAKAGLDAAGGLNLPETEEFLARLRKTLEAAMSETAAPGEPSPSAVNDSAPAAASPVTKPSAAPSAQSGSMPQAINSRRDVENALENIIAFYERTEPSSPIPHLAKRMHRMVSMDFLQLMEEIAPSGMKEFRAVAGVEDPKKK